MRVPIFWIALIALIFGLSVASESPSPIVAKKVPHCFATAKLSFSISANDDGGGDSKRVDYSILMTSTIVSKSTLQVLCSVRNEPVTLSGDDSVRVPCKGGVGAVHIEGPKSIEKYKNIGLRLPHTDYDVLMTTSDTIDVVKGPPFQQLEYHVGKAFPCSSLQPDVDL